MTRTPAAARRVFHLMPSAAWAQAEGPLVAVEHFNRNGFVHCCTREQLLEIAGWWLKDEAPLVAIELDADALDEVRFERAEGEAREYPHVYAPLARSAIVGVHELPQDPATGAFCFPPALADPPPRFTVDGVFASRPVVAEWQHGVGLVVDVTDASVARAAAELVDKGAEVAQFLDITTTASLDSPYDAFSVLCAVLDEVTSYRGDGFA